MAPAWNARPPSPLNFSPISYSPSEIIVPGSSDEDSPEIRQAKKLQRERLGQEYLRGRPPTMITADLRGPLHHGWSNPWAGTKQLKFDRPYIIPGQSRARPSADASGYSSEGSERSSEGGSEIDSGSSESGEECSTINHSALSSDSEDYSSDQKDSEQKIVKGKKERHKSSESMVNTAGHIKTEIPEGLLVSIDRARKASKFSDTPTPMPHVPRKNSKRKTPIPTDTSSSEDSTSEDEIPHKPDSATRFNNAIKEASRIKDEKSIRKQKNSRRENPARPPPLARGAHKSITKTEVVEEPQLVSDLEDHAASVVEAGQPQDGGNARKKRKNRKSTHHSSSRRQSEAQSSERQAAKSTSHQKQTAIEVPIDFWVEPVRGLLGFATMAKAMKEGLISLTPERLQQKYQAALNQPQPGTTFEQAHTNRRRTRQPVTDRMITRNQNATTNAFREVESVTISKSPHVLPPSTNLAEFRYVRVANITNTVKEASSQPPSLDFPKGVAKVESLSGRMKGSRIEIRVPPRPSQDLDFQHSSNEPSTTSEVLQDAQNDLQQPGQNVKIPSGSSTNLLETDKQSLNFINSEEGPSEFELSTQAQITNAQRSFQLDLVSPEKILMETSPTSSIKRRTRSMGKQDFHITPFRAIRSPRVGAKSQKSQGGDFLPATQDLIDKMTPFVITTTKKSSRKRSAGVTASPSKRRSTKTANMKDTDRRSDRKSVDTQATLGDPDSDYSPILFGRRSTGDLSPQKHLRSRTSDQTKPSAFSSPQFSTKHQARNTRGQFSNSEPLSEMKMQQQSQPSPSKSRHLLRSFPSSQSASQLQQDGQQYLHAGWTVEEAIDDAGSYLGTWDVETEVRRGKRTRNRSSQG